MEARIQSFELAYQMQLEATDAFDIKKEPANIRAMYKADTEPGRQMLIARRLLEKAFVLCRCGKAAGIIIKIWKRVYVAKPANGTNRWRRSSPI